MSILLSAIADEHATVPQGRSRARDLGIKIGIYEPGKYNAITDVAGVKVGHVTLHYGESVRTGVTAVIPRDDIWVNKVFGAGHIINGNGEATGLAWTNEAGWIESPIMLTNTLDARTAVGKRFLLHQLAFRLNRRIRLFQCWCGIGEIRKFNFSVLDYPNGQY